MDGLTEADLDFLMDAVEKYKYHEVPGEILGDFMVAMMTGGDPIAKSAYNNEKAKEKIRVEGAQKLRMERAIFVQAKLLAMKQEMAINRL